ncbi:Neutral ceramidase [Saguinus oedipus]|uniref:Neutral ceramidase n=1 Tax=Saguinus oedipus TaxID=9490 RepID=A0ABQ9UNI2_SAGOE|nr:Neutral ceramidase [Saguinus oedipus]
MNNSNHLVNSDNVGYASYLLEQEKNKGYLPGQLHLESLSIIIYAAFRKGDSDLQNKGPFVAAFASSNLGDVSPNILGPHCINTGESCDNPNSTCPIGGPHMCIAKGPGQDMLDSTQIIGRTMYQRAKQGTASLLIRRGKLQLVLLMTYESSHVAVETGVGTVEMS